MKDRKAHDFITSAFDDYLAGRFLLLNRYSLNGVILSSLAVEKYLKAILTILNIDFKRIHFDNIEKLKAAFDNSQFKEIFSYVDPRFLELLSLAYKFRYYDNIKERTTVGFATHQIIAELDLFVGLIEKLLIIEVDGKQAQTPYQRAVEQKDIRVWECNMLLNELDKKTFYQQETYCFGLHIDPDKLGPIQIEGFQIKLPYNGRISRINLRYEGAL